MPSSGAPQIDLSEKDLQKWKRRIEASRDLRKKRMDVWKDCVQAYLGKPLLTTPDHDVIAVNKEFPFVEQKKAQLAFQVPEVQLKPRLPGLEQATLLFQSALNHELGSDGANLIDTVDETLSDVLLMGIGPTKIGYVATVDEREVDEPVTDPMTGQPAVDPMTGQPQMAKRLRPVQLKEEYFWERIDPQDYLVPHDFEGIDFDRAPWQGFEFEEDWSEETREKYGLPKDFSTFKRDKQKESISGEKDGGLQGQTPQISGVELWYYASLYDGTERHPDQMRLLVLIDGSDEAVRHENSPYQRTNDQGKLTGLKGHPIHVLTLRNAPGCAYPPSDVELTRHLSDELSRIRTNMVQQRESAIPMRWADMTRADPQTVEKINKGHWYAIIPTNGNGNEIFGELARANFPRETPVFNEIIDRDYEESWALGKAQRGLTDDTQRTATELQIAQGAASVRLDKERARVLKWFTTGARKFGALLQLFKTEDSYVEILGDQAQGLQVWNRERIQGEFVFQAKPDSALRIDAQQERQQHLQLYNMTGKDPNVNRVELLKSIFQKFNLDPSRIVVEKLPEPKPEPPKLALSFKGEDALNEAAMMLAQANGIVVPPQLLQMAQMAGMVRQVSGQADAEGVAPPHGGPAEQAEPISKHATRGAPGVDGSGPALGTVQ